MLAHFGVIQIGLETLFQEKVMHLKFLCYSIISKMYLK